MSLKTIKVSYSNIPSNFTGIVKWSDGTKLWYINGKCHREDGPAREWSDGIKEWYLNNIKLSEEQHKIIMMFSEKSREKLYENDNHGLKNLLAIK